MSSLIRHKVLESNRRLIAVAAFSTDIYTWNATAGLAVTGVSAANAAARVILIDTNKKLFPGIHVGTTPVTTVMISVGFIGASDGLVYSGYIDAANPKFASYTDVIPGSNDALAADQYTSGVNTSGPITTTGLTTLSGGVTVPTTRLTTTTAAVALASYGGGFILVDQSGADYTITLPTAAEMIGVKYTFMLSSTLSDFIVSITAPSAILYGTAVLGVAASVLAVSANTTVQFTGSAVAGDTIEVVGLNAAHILVRAVTSAVDGIAVA